MELGLVMKKYARVRWKRETEVIIVLADMSAIVALCFVGDGCLDVLRSSNRAVSGVSQDEAVAVAKEGETDSREGGAQEAKYK
jgi:hypothetical protein